MSRRKKNVSQKLASSYYYKTLLVYVQGGIYLCEFSIYRLGYSEPKNRYKTVPMQLELQKQTSLYNKKITK